MGLAASQARFLGLTARMSNTEYQGQQINQQRTALSNESANIYNQMMDLTVPTPPSTSDYMKTNYVLEDSSFGSSSDFTIKNTVKNGTGENRYTVKLGYSETTAVGFANSTAKVSSVSRVAVKSKETENDYYKYTTTIAGASVVYDSENCKAYKTDSEGNVIQKTDKNQIYLIDDETKKFNLSGYTEAVDALKADKQYNDGDKLYFYEGTDGKNYFLTEKSLKSLTEGAYTDKPDSTDTIYYAENEKHAQLAYTTNQTKNYTVDVQATLESASNGRYSTITIDSQEGIPSNLKGATFSITTTQTTDEDAYNDAFNDYEYQKAIYEQNISDLNAKTKVIQQEDQQLELRLKQLDTERNALNTEIESVKKVIQDNVDKTFKIFA